MHTTSTKTIRKGDVFVPSLSITNSMTKIILNIEKQNINTIKKDFFYRFNELSFVVGAQLMGDSAGPIVGTSCEIEFNIEKQ